MRNFNIAVAPGDGIGPEVVSEGVLALKTAASRFAFQVELAEIAVGGASIEKHGEALTSDAIRIAKGADAVLLGAVGDPKYDSPEQAVRPEQAILGLRKELGLFANLRPVKVMPNQTGASPLRPEVVAGTDMMIVRELTGGIYFGEPRERKTTSKGREAIDTMIYNEHEIKRIVELAFSLAESRRKKVTSVDKANVLFTSRLWREIANEVKASHPSVELEHMLVDACAMQLLRAPKSFDVIVTENMFGDILTDEASMLPGSIGLMPSASLGQRRNDGIWPGLYEPIHGSAPSIAGRGIANPIGTILSVAMMLRWSFGLEKEAASIERAVSDTLQTGIGTPDIVQSDVIPCKTAELGAAICERIR